MSDLGKWIDMKVYAIEIDPFTRRGHDAPTVDDWPCVAHLLESSRDSRLSAFLHDRCGNFRKDRKYRMWIEETQ